MSGLGEYPQRFLNQYYLSERLGGGTYGDVYAAFNMENDEVYAVKVLKPNELVEIAFEDEVAAHQVLSSLPNCQKYVVCLTDSGYYEYTKPIEKEDFYREQAERKGLKYEVVKGNYYYLVSELMDGNLTDIIEFILKKDIDVHPNVITYLVLQLFKGLKYIHSRQMAHRDIKPDNILYKIQSPIDEKVSLLECLLDTTCTTAMINLELKYGDLGFSCTDFVMQEDIPTEVHKCNAKQGTLLYFSPELAKLLVNNLDLISLFIAKTSDVWALAVTLWKFLYLDDPPFLLGVNTIDALFDSLLFLTPELITEMMIENPVPVSNADLADVLQITLNGMFNPDPKRRIKMDTAIEEIEQVL